MNLQQQLARLEQRCYEREHHARLGMGRLDRTYLDLQERRRELSAAWMEEMTAKLRQLQRENAALRARAGDLQDDDSLRHIQAEEVEVMLTEDQGFVFNHKFRFGKGV